MSHALRVVVPVVALAALLSACSGSGSSPPSAGGSPGQHSSAPGPPASSSGQVPVQPATAPQVGSCYRLGYDEALAPTLAKRPAPCTRVHTAVAFFVGRFDRHLAVDGAQVRHLESTACTHRFATYVGGTLDQRRVSMLRTVWFAPSAEQAAVGSHWFVCTAIALRGDQNLALLRGPLHGVLAETAGRDHYGMCGTAEPGQAGFEQRVCAAPHAWRALRTVGFAPGIYPGVDKVRSAGEEICKSAANDVASDPLHYTWSYQWPSRQQWRAGQTYGVCWTPS
ncbi:MAG TPA: septum formation family protein [Nocardioides sp.]|jgi:hypothetical protein|uniref:septum formation family protein n=1 Tax=Nocardioides sp. TaxID=35761 RepID=UPI002E34DCF3|nr:septum formation family protein [Nocardioides sp.]HEX3931291.1 septum formation family protein [Nocardioides sp.]